MIHLCVQRRTKQFDSLDEKFGDAVLRTFESAIEKLKNDTYHLTDSNQQRAEGDRSHVVSTFAHIVFTASFTALTLENCHLRSHISNVLADLEFSAG